MTGRHLPWGEPRSLGRVRTFQTVSRQRTARREPGSDDALAGRPFRVDLPLNHRHDATAAPLDDVVPVADEHDLAVPNARDQAFERLRTVDQAGDAGRDCLADRDGDVLL